MAKPTPATVSPTIGRIVYFGEIEIAGDVNEGDLTVARAALVTALDDDALPTLQIFHPSGQANIQRHVRQSDKLMVGCWCWPPRD